MSLSAANQYLLNKMNNVAKKISLGDLLQDALGQVTLAESAKDDAETAQAAAEAAQASAEAAAASLKKLCLKAQYSFDDLGGAVGDIGLGVSLPDNAVITNVVIDVIDTLTSGGLATVAIKAQTAADLYAATAFGSITGIKQGIPNNVVANMIKTTATREITATVAVAALTGGKFNVFVEYLVSD